MHIQVVTKHHILGIQVWGEKKNPEVQSLTLAEHILSMYKALGSIPSPGKKDHPSQRHGRSHLLLQSKEVPA
jgi:hypothetical protein